MLKFEAKNGAQTKSLPTLLKFKAKMSAHENDLPTLLKFKTKAAITLRNTVGR